MITQQEFEGILADMSKVIDGDITWREDADHSPARGFRVEVRSDPGWPLLMVGRFDPYAGTLSYELLHRGAGRIYGLDLGADHHNPGCQRIGEKHKHRRTEAFRDKEAYAPSDITASWDQPQQVVQQFCREVNIHRKGQLHPLGTQEELPL